MIGHLPPFTTMQECNLDWILVKVKDILRFVPDDGAVGQILRRTQHGAEWSNEQGGGGGAVNSVNGQTGDVVLTASDVGALPDTTPIPTNTSDLNNDSGFVDAAGAAAAAPVQSVNGQTGAVTITAPVTSVNGQTGSVVLGKSDVGLGNVDNVQQYSASNPPPYPVTSVNGQTGDVTISGGAVDSVNGQTGTVVLAASDVGAWSKLGERSASLTFPYTPTQDGVLYYRFTVQNSANPAWAYIYIASLSWYIAQAYTTNGVAVAGNIPVKAGWTLTNPTKQNCVLNALYFIPFE